MAGHCSARIRYPSGPDVHLTNQGHGANQQPNTRRRAFSSYRSWRKASAGTRRSRCCTSGRSPSPGGACSLLFEPHPATGHLHATSGAGIESLPTGSWHPDGREGALLARSFAEARRCRRAAPLRTDAAASRPSRTERGASCCHSRTTAGDSGCLPSACRRTPTTAPAALQAQRRACRLHPGARALPASAAGRVRTGYPRSARRICGPASPPRSISRAPSNRSAWRDPALRCRPDDGLAARARVAHRSCRTASSDASYLRDRRIACEPTTRSRRRRSRCGRVRAGLATNRSEATSVLTVPLRGCRRALGSMVFEGVSVEPGDDITS